jgi:SPP1 family phage portal protein
MLFERKANKDLQLAKWFYVCGTAYRLILPNKLETSEDGSAPFRIYTLSPMRAFVVYSDTVEGLPVLGVKVSYDADDTTKMHPIYNCYSDNMFFKVQDDKIIKAEPHILGGIPIIEYPANDERLGAFEIVLPLLDAINITASGRIDGLEQFIQSLMKFVNADISTEDFEKLKDLGCIKVKDTNGTAQIEFMDHELNQTQIQTLIDWEYDAVLTIVGMPNRNGGSSTSDTGAAVIMRDGWSDAEARAKEDENMFKDSETEFLKIALRICRLFNELSLNIWNVDVRFTRRNYENIEQKSTVLTTLLASGKVHPKLAFEHCGMFTDPTLAYEMSKSYIEEQEKKAEEQANRQIEGQANTESADKEGSDVKD